MLYISAVINPAMAHVRSHLPSNPSARIAIPTAHITVSTISFLTIPNVKRLDVISIKYFASLYRFTAFCFITPVAISITMSSPRSQNGSFGTPKYSRNARILANNPIFILAIVAVVVPTSGIIIFSLSYKLGGASFTISCGMPSGIGGFFMFLYSSMQVSMYFSISHRSSPRSL